MGTSKTWASLVVVATGVSLGCAKSGEETTKEDIEIGVITSLTGSSGASEQLRGVELAVEEINLAGGVLGGRKLVVRGRDDGSSGDTARTVAEELVTQNKVVAIIGASRSGSTIPLSEVTIPAKVPVVSGSATSPTISDLDDDGYVSRTCPSDALQGKLLAQRTFAKGVTHVATLHGDNPYGKGLSDSFATAFQALGGTVTAKKTVADGKTSYVAELTELYAPAQPPQAILMPLYNFEAALVIKDYNTHFKSKNTYWLFTDSNATQAFIDSVGGQSGFTFPHEGTGPAIPTSASAAAFIAGYVAKYGSEPPETTSYAANFYDAAYLVALAIEAAGKAEGAAIKDQLPLVSKGGTSYTPLDFKAAVAALGAGEDINFDGASGPLDLDAKGDPLAPYDIWKVQNGKVVVVESSVNP